MTDADDLASAYLPDGVEVNDTTRHVAAQLALSWLQLTAQQRRLVIAFEATLDPAAAAKAAGYNDKVSAGKAAIALASERVRLVQRLRSTLQTETIPPPMIGRILTRIALGIDESTPHARIRAAIELARVQGAYVPPSALNQQPGADETGLEELDQAAQDRIVQAAMHGGASFAELLRTRAEEAAAEQAQALEQESAQAEVQAIARQAAEAQQPAKKRKFNRGVRQGPAPIDPVLGTIPEHLANTDALAAARAKMKGPTDG